MERFAYLRKSELEEQSQPFTLASVGFVDNPKHPLGIMSTQAVPLRVKNPHTKNDVYFTPIFYPLKGGGLISLLAASAPTDFYYPKGVIDDWRLPDLARKFYPISEAKSLHERHQKLPGYNEFDTNHRTKWVQASLDVEAYAFFETFYHLSIVDQQKFFAAKIREFTDQLSSGGSRAKDEPGSLFAESVDHWFNHYASQGRKERRQVTAFKKRLIEQAKTRHFDSARIGSIIDHGFEEDKTTSEDIKLHTELFTVFLQEAPSAPKELRDLLMGRLLEAINFQTIFFDKGTRKTTTPWRDNTVTPNIKTRERLVVVSDSRVSASMEIGPLQENGLYPVQDTRMQFSPSYYDASLLPLIAFEQTAGKRRFLTQPEAQELLPRDAITAALPVDLRTHVDPSQFDVTLGRVLLAYGQPDVGETFATHMKLPEDKKGDPQRIQAAQLPVFVSLPGYEKKLLGTPQIDRLIEASK